MTSTKLVQNEIARFLSTKEPEVLCVSGEWGVGKTFVWQMMLDKAKQEKTLGINRYAYVSLFGISSLEGLKLTTFENSEFLLPEQTDDLQAKAKKHGNFLLRWGQKSTKIAAELPYVGDIVKSVSPLFFSAVRSQIVCIDDLERRSADLPVKDVLGLISFLKEQRKCKVVLLMNEKELDEVGEKDFKSYFEKVVDVAVRFTPTAEDAVLIALPGTDTASRLIGENCKALQISNIRVIKKIERFVRAVERLVSRFDEGVFQQSVWSLTLFGWSKYQPGAAPPIDYLRSKKGAGLLGIQAKKNVSNDEASWDAILSAYGFIGMSEFDAALLDGIENGFFDPERIKQCAINFEVRIKAQKQNDSFEEAWESFHGSFANNQSEVLDTLYGSFKRNVQNISPINLSGTVDLFKQLGFEIQAKELIHFYMDERREVRRFWDLGEYTFAEHVTDPDVVKAFNDRLKTFKLDVDPVAALLKIATRGEWDDHDLAKLASLSSEEYYSLFKTHAGRQLSRMVSGALKFGNIVNASDEMKGISGRAKDALVRIGMESKINAMRVRKFGIRIDEEAGISMAVVLAELGKE